MRCRSIAIVWAWLAACAGPVPAGPGPAAHARVVSASRAQDPESSNDVLRDLCGSPIEAWLGELVPAMPRCKRHRSRPRIQYVRARSTSGDVVVVAWHYYLGAGGCSPTREGRAIVVDGRVVPGLPVLEPASDADARAILRAAMLHATGPTSLCTEVACRDRSRASWSHAWSIIEPVPVGATGDGVSTRLVALRIEHDRHVGGWHDEIERLDAWFDEHGAPAVGRTMLHEESWSRADSAEPPPRCTEGVGEVWIVAMPFGRVLVDGRELGDSPLRTSVPVGTHTIAITHDGEHVLASREVVVECGSRQEVILRP